MTDLEYKNTLYEVNEILKILDQSLIDKLPVSVIEEIKKNKSDHYNFKMDYKKSLKEQKMLETTEQYLASLYLKYWCNQTEKEEVLELMHQNEVNYQEELKEKYNPDNLFKRESIPNTSMKDVLNSENLKLVEIKKKSIWSKLLHKIKKIFSKDKKSN